MRTTVVVLAAAVILFVTVGVTSIIGISRQSDDAEAVEHSHEVLEGLETTLRLAIDARRDAVAYVATGDPYRLEVFDRSRREGEVAASHVADLTKDDPLQQRRIRNVRVLLGKESAEQIRVISIRNTNPAAAIDELRSTAWISRFDTLQAAIGAMKTQEQHNLDLRNEREDASVARAKGIVIAGDVLAFALATGALVLSARQARQREQSELRVAAANRELTARVSDLQQRSRELSLLTRLGELLQSCENADESASVIRQVLPQLFEGSEGAVFTIISSRNLVVPLTGWPDSGRTAVPFAPADCWALRRGAIHDITPGGVNVVCKHAAARTANRSVCVPLLAHGEAIGLLHVAWMEGGSALNELAGAVAEQLGLAQANLTLQETLRRQAMRDPLTGVFNRRYMEETLARELHRAARQHSALSLLMLDLDRFKEYNDTLGHFAGDDLLRSAAATMQRAVRADDVVCRYGGDEFVIIMPDAEGAIVDQRAASLLDQLQQFPRGDAAGPGHSVTVSIGIAAYPADATEPQELLLVADRALYQAKRAGRARFARASLPTLT